MTHSDKWHHICDGKKLTGIILRQVKAQTRSCSIIVGAGYHLVMVKDKTCDVSKVTSVIQQFVPTAKQESDIGAELSYLLPFDQSPHFQSLFLAIEEKSQSLGIQSFGTTATTMEEVFLK